MEVKRRRENSRPEGGREWFGKEVEGSIMERVWIRHRRAQKNGDSRTSKKPRPRCSRNPRVMRKIWGRCRIQSGSVRLDRGEKHGILFSGV